MPPLFKPLAFARVNAFMPDQTFPTGIEFLSQDGFNPTPGRSHAGVYQLSLKEPPVDRNQTVVVVSRNNSGPGEIAASVLGDGSLQINSFNTEGAQVDSPFSILVYEATLVEPAT